MKKIIFPCACVVMVSGFVCLGVKANFDPPSGQSPYTGMKTEDCCVADPPETACQASVYPPDPDLMWCYGEIIEGPFASSLTRGQQVNNMSNDYNYHRCADRFVCKWSPALEKCVKHGNASISYTRGVNTIGPDCYVPERG